MIPPVSMDIPTRDTFACVQIITREKTVKKVSLIFFFNVMKVLHPACGQLYVSPLCFLCLDRNECIDNTHDCHAKAVSNNTEGSFSCTEGYQGDGRNCTGEIHRYSQRHIDNNEIFL